MTDFVYTAVNSAGQTISGRKSCTNRNRLSLELLQADLLLVSCRRCWLVGFGLRQRNEFEELALQLEFQLKANISLLDSLQLISRAQRASGATLADALLTSVSEGRPLSQATAESPEIFGRLAPALLGVGERTGNMVEAVAEIHRSLVHARESRQRLQQAIMYPVLVACTLLLVTIFMLLRVVPDLVALLTNLNVELPLITQVMLGWSNLIREKTEWLLGMSGLCLVSFVLTLRHPQVRLQMQRWQLCLPGLGLLLLEIRLARFSRALAILISTGVNLLDALAVARPVLELAYLESKLNDVRSAVLAGQALSVAIRRQTHFPAHFCQLIELGESTGSVASMLHHAAQSYDRSIIIKLRKIEFWSATALLMLMGLILIVIVLSVVGPLYDSFDQVQGF